MGADAALGLQLTRINTRAPDNGTFNVFFYIYNIYDRLIDMNKNYIYD